MDKTEEVFWVMEKKKDSTVLPYEYQDYNGDPVYFAGDAQRYDTLEQLKEQLRGYADEGWKPVKCTLIIERSEFHDGI